MTVPELKSTVYLLPEVAWPIIKQTVATTGNHAVLWRELSCANIILRLLVTRDNMAGFRASLWVFLSLFSWDCPWDCQLRSLLSSNLSVYRFVGTLVKTKIPTTTNIYFRHETKRGRRELTTLIIPCIVLAWLKIKKKMFSRSCWNQFCGRGNTQTRLGRRKSPRRARKCKWNADKPWRWQSWKRLLQCLLAKKKLVLDL